MSASRCARRRAALYALAALGSLVLACGGDAGPTDAGDPTPDAGDDIDGGIVTCAAHADCDDGFFCNGPERCAPGDPAANARGCVLGVSPCTDACDEAADACETCVDADRDGRPSAACGGDDCDDDDPHRYPGNTEVCDREGRDEDCDPTTLGPDRDGDGYVDQACCNLQLDGELLCGRDCDDESSDVHPEIIDVCGNGDQNCDGELDDAPDEVFYRDADGDGFGDPDDATLACGAPEGYVLLGTDCDDASGEVSPGVEERCDSAMVDEDCDGEVNEGCECTPAGTTRPCEGSNVGECRAGTQTCILGGDSRTLWSTCQDRVEPRAEACNGRDDDCNGVIDDGPGFECRQGDPPSTGVNACGRGASRSCDVATCRWAPPTFVVPETASTCDYCDDSGAGLAAESAFASASATTSLPVTTHYEPNPATLTRTAAAFADPLVVGYGTVRFELRASIDEPTRMETRNGWALVLVREDPVSSSPLLGAEGDVLGVPRGRDGIAVEWRFYDVDDRSNTDDSLVLRQLRASGDDPIVARVPNPGPDAYTSIYHGSSTRRDQRVRLTITPDMPGDAANDTVVIIEYWEYAAWQPGAACGGSAPACPFRIASGERYHFGATNSVGYTSGDVNDQTVISIVSSAIVREGLCP